MSTNPSQLFLLADHIKLSLLERQRAQALSLPANTHDASIQRSLSSFLDRLEALETEVQTTPDSTLQGQAAQLRKQYDEMNGQFQGTDSSSSRGHKPSTTLTQPNDASLAADFVAAQTGPRKALRPGKSGNGSNAKNVPYRDDPTDEARNTLFTGSSTTEYRDEPSPSRGGGGGDGAGGTAADAAAGLDNQQIHAQHSEIIAEQDEALDRLGVSIGRQRELSMRIGDELDEQVAMLDDVEEGVDRHQGRLDGARSRLDRFARKAGRVDWSWYVIGALILVLLLLIVILK